MSYRWIGAALVFAACGGCGFSIAAHYRYEYDTLKKLKILLDMMECELSYHLTPLPELCRKSGTAAGGVLKKVMASLAEELDKLNGVGVESGEIPLKEDDTVNPNEPEAIRAQGESEENKPKVNGAKGSYAICPVCGKRFIKQESNQIYDSRSCANRGRRSTPRYGG